MDDTDAIDGNIQTANDNDTPSAVMMPASSSITDSSFWEDSSDEDDPDGISPWSFSHYGNWLPQSTCYNDSDKAFTMHQVSPVPIEQSTFDKLRAAGAVFVSPSILEAAGTLMKIYYSQDSQPAIANSSVKLRSTTSTGCSPVTGSSGDIEPSDDTSNDSLFGDQAPDYEKVFTNLGYTMRDFVRSYLTYDEVPRSAILWAPPCSTRASNRPAPNPLQSNNTTCSARVHDLVCPDASWSSTVSFRSFAQYILPGTTSLYVFITPQINASFYVTGPSNSRGLMPWHSPKNTASLYEWGGLYSAKRAGLEGGWIEVRGIISRPHMWERLEPYAGLEHTNMAEFPFKQFHIGYLFCLPYIRDEHHETLPLCLDVGCMHNEFSQPKVKPVLMRFNCENSIQLPEGWNTKKGKGIVGGLEFTRLMMGLGEEMRVITKKKGVLEAWRICSFD